MRLPEHKYEIVQRLQQKKHICGMTGDGVNDAPALKKADIGIAVADATDAARSASDIVLTEPGLSVIISAVLTSRSIFQRMKNYTVTSAYSITIGLYTSNTSFIYLCMYICAYVSRYVCIYARECIQTLYIVNPMLVVIPFFCLLYDLLCCVLFYKILDDVSLCRHGYGTCMSEFYAVFVCRHGYPMYM